LIVQFHYEEIGSNVDQMDINPRIWDVEIRMGRTKSIRDQSNEKNQWEMSV